MSSASQQFNATDGASYEYTDYNGEIGNIITHINNIYALIDDNTGTSPLTVDTTNDRLGINITAPLSELHVADAAGSVEGRFDSTITGTTYGLYMGADSNEPYIGSRTNHGLRIVTNSVKTAYFATDYSLRLFSSDASGTYAAIGSDASDNLYLLPGGTGLVNVVGTDLALRAGKAVRVYSPGDSNYSLISNDSNDNLIFTPYANGDVIALGRHPRDNSGSATYVTSHIQSGWGYTPGDGTANISDSATFPIAFSSDNVRVCVFGMSSRSGSNPSDEGDLTTGTATAVYEATDITASGFSINIWNSTGGALGSSAIRYGWGWIAIGPV